MPQAPEATLVREQSSRDGTFGVLTLRVSEAVPPLVLHTLELPWKNNERTVSCVVAGTYRCAFKPSAKFGGNRYRLQNVPSRSGILFHAGNVAGDVTLGLRSDVEGCILLGLAVGAVGSQRAVIASREAVARFEQALAGLDFTLTISWKAGA